MELEIALKRPLFIVGIWGIALTLIIVFYLSLGLPDQASYAKPDWQTGKLASKNPYEYAPAGYAALSEPADAGVPVRLMIPAINVNAGFEFVGLTSDEAVDVPKDPANAGWFIIGPRPGDRGSAVIDGHFGWGNGVPAVFDDLHKLQKDDKIFIEDDKGAVISFVVRGFRRYGPSDDVSGVFHSNDGKAHLNLITCEGIWNENQKTYSHRLVVFTEREFE